MSYELAPQFNKKKKTTIIFQRNLLIGVSIDGFVFYST